MTGADRPAVEVSGLSKRYGNTVVLRDLDLQVDAGEFVALTGPSGCGKSTLLRILGGLDLEYSGTVRVGGVAPKGLNDRALSRFRGSQVGMVFQSFNLLPHLTLLENVALPALFAGATDVEERARALLDAVGLGGRANDRPDQLSGGQAQRVAIARTLVNHPSVILCDEPTGSLDPATANDVLALLRRFNDEDDATVVLVTHHAEVADTADRVIALERVDGVAP